jgi:VCBS repeat-containing protein
LVNGETITATATDAANNTSDPATTVAPIQIDAIDDSATADLEVSPALVDSLNEFDSQFSLIGLGALTLLNFGSNPNVDFTIPEGQTGDATITVENSSLVGVFDTGRAVIQKLNEDTGNYETVDSVGQSGLITLIGIGGGRAQIELPDLEAGTYRVVGGAGGISLLGTTSVRAEVDVFDPSVAGDITAVPVSGNVIDENDVATDNTIVTEVNGQPVNATGTTTIVGEYGNLVIDSDGAYTYTPNENAGGIGKADEFNYTIVDTVTNSTDSATLTVGIESDFPAVNFDVDAVNDTATTELIVNPLVEVDNVVGVQASGSPARPTTIFEIDEGNTGSAVISANGGGGIFGSANVSIQLQLEDVNGVFQTIRTSNNATLSVANLEAGTYRIQGTIDDGIIFTTTNARFNATVTQTNPSEPGSYNSVAATGNVIDENDMVTPSTVVTEVNGQPVNASGTTTIVGDYGNLVISSDGTYTYTPNSDVTVIDQVDEFTYTINDDFNNTDTAVLSVTIESDFPAPAPVAARMMLDDSFSLADDADADSIDLPETSLAVSDEGLNVLSFEGADQVISLADIMEPEIVDISGTGANTLNVAAEDIDSAIYVKGDSDDTVNLEGDSWSTVGQTTSGGDTYNAWQSGDDASTQIYIDTNVNIL